MEKKSRRNLNVIQHRVVSFLNQNVVNGGNRRENPFFEQMFILKVLMFYHRKFGVGDGRVFLE